MNTQPPSALASHGTHLSSTAELSLATRVPTLEDLHALAARPAEVTVSLYLPVNRTGNGKHENHIRLRNLIHQAASQLAAGVDAQTAVAVAGQLDSLAGSSALWAHPGDGMAVFATASMAQAFHLPLTIPEFVAVGSHCHLKPLASILQCDGLFYVLELSQHGVRLHKGSHFGMREITLLGGSPSVDEVCQPVSGERQGERRPMHGGPSSAHYFSVTGDEKARERIRAYFRNVNASICALLHGSQAPLVIAGMGFLLPLYRSVNHYPHLVEGGIDAGNPEAPSDHHLHHSAWEMVAPHFARSSIAARERLAQLHGTNRVSAELSKILHAAREGRVADLFIAADSVRWGSFDERDEKVREHKQRWSDDDDLLNLALIHALGTRAHIHVQPRSELPESSDVHALFRY